MDIAQFRLDFPEFANTGTYTDAMCTYWSTLGESLNSPTVFGNVYTQLIELYTAHNLSIQAKNILTTTVGGIPAGDAGAINEQSEGTVSVSFDATSSSISGGSIFNQTYYGRQYLQLQKTYAKGVIPIQTPGGYPQNWWGVPWGGPWW